MFGCGIFAPLNWYAKDPGIFIKSTLLICLPAGTIGLFLSLFCYSVDEEQVNVIFGVFCLFLIGTVIYGLFHDLTTHDEPITFKVKSWKDIGTILLYFVCSLIGGMIAGKKRSLTIAYSCINYSCHSRLDWNRYRKDIFFARNKLSSRRIEASNDHCNNNYWLVINDISFYSFLYIKGCSDSLLGMQYSWCSIGINYRTNNQCIYRIKQCDDYLLHFLVLKCSI